MLEHSIDAMSLDEPEEPKAKKTVDRVMRKDGLIKRNITDSKDATLETKDTVTASHVIRVYDGVRFSKYLTDTKTATKIKHGWLHAACGRYRRFEMYTLDEHGFGINKRRHTTMTIPRKGLLFEAFYGKIFWAPTEDAKRAGEKIWKCGDDDEVAPVYYAELDAVCARMERTLHLLTAGKTSPRSKFLESQLRNQKPMPCEHVLEHIALVMALEHVSGSDMRYVVGVKEDVDGHEIPVIDVATTSLV